MAGFDSAQVATLLRQIGSHDELLAEAYVAGSVLMDEHNSQKIALLHKNGILRPDDEPGEYRLSTELKRMLNRLLHKQSSYRQLTDMGKVIDALDDTVRDYQRNWQQGERDNAEFYLEQLDDLLYEAQDNLTTSLDNMHYAITCQFGFVSSLSAKVHENERALQHARKLLDELQQIDPETCYEWIDWPCPNEFARKITGFIHWFRQTLPRLRLIIEKMRQSLFRLRRDEKQANQLRAMARYLRQHPEFELDEELFRNPALPETLQLAPPLALLSYIDPRACTLEEPLVALIQSLRKTETAPHPVERESSQVTITETVEEQWQPDFFEQEVELLFEKVISSDQPLSALTHWQERQPHWQEQEQQLAPKAWIELVFSIYCQLTYEQQSAFSLEMKGETQSGTTHNILYHDIEVSLQQKQRR